MRTQPVEFANVASLRESQPNLEKGTYIIFYKSDVDDMRELFPNLSVLKTGKIWTIARYE